MMLSQEEKGEEEKEHNKFGLVLWLVAIRRGLVMLMADLRLENSELRNIFLSEKSLCIVFSLLFLFFFLLKTTQNQHQHQFN